ENQVALRIERAALREAEAAEHFHVVRDRRSLARFVHRSERLADAKLARSGLLGLREHGRRADAEHEACGESQGQLDRVIPLLRLRQAEQAAASAAASSVPGTV